MDVAGREVQRLAAAQAHPVEQQRDHDPGVAGVDLGERPTVSNESAYGERRATRMLRGP